MSDKEQLTIFFNQMIRKFNRKPNCEESGKRISNITRWNIAHIFPKRDYKSVQCEELNVVLLTRELHTEFDHYLDRFQFEKIEEKFPKSWQKLKKVLPLVEEDKRLKLKLENYLKQN